MRESGDIYHKGIIKNVSGVDVKVEVITESACSSCEVSGSCEVSDKLQKDVDVRVPNGEFENGEIVNVVLTEQQGVLATSLGYVLPFVLILITLFLTSKYTDNELIIGLFALGILLPYYLILYLLKQQIKSKLGFRIEKTITS